MLGRAVVPPLLWQIESGFFQLPTFEGAPLSALAAAVGIGMTLLAVTACYLTIRRELRERPAFLLRPKAPAVGGAGMFARVVMLWVHLDSRTRSVLRSLGRYKLRTMMAMMGITFSAALFLSALGMRDTILYSLRYHYEEYTRYDAAAYVRQGQQMQTGEWESLPVCTVVLTRLLPIEVRGKNGNKSMLLRVLPQEQDLLDLPKLSGDGVLLSSKYADALDIRVGDTIQITAAGKAAPVDVLVDGLYDAVLEQAAYMNVQAFGHLLVPAQSQEVLLLQGLEQGWEAALEAMPKIGSWETEANQRTAANDLLSAMIGMIGLIILFALILAGVVIYNTALLSYLEQERDYATLRVLGYQPAEVRGMMIMESMLVAAFSSLLAIWPGRLLIGIVLGVAQPDNMQVIVQLDPLSVLVSQFALLFFVWLIQRFMARRASKVDMVAALKSAE